MAVEYLLGGLYLLILGLCGAGVIAWIGFITCRLQGVDVLPLEPRRRVPWGFPAIILLVGLWILGASLVADLLVSLGALVPPARNEAGQVVELSASWMAVGAATQLVVILGFSGLLIATRFVRSDDLGISLRKFGRNLAIGLVGAMMILPVTYLVQAVAIQFIEYHHPLIDLFDKGADLRLFLTAAAIAVISAPICEELLFRVYLQGWLESLSLARRERQLRLGEEDLQVTAAATHEPLVEENAVADTTEGLANPPLEHPAEQAEERRPLRPGYWPIFVSSGLFAIVHLGQGPAPIALFFMALGLGYLYRQTHSFWPPFIVHFTLNGITMVGTFLTTMVPDDSPLAPPKEAELPTAAIVEINAERHVPSPLD